MDEVYALIAYQPSDHASLDELIDQHHQRTQRCLGYAPWQWSAELPDQLVVPHVRNVLYPRLLGRKERFQFLPRATVNDQPRFDVHCAKT
jgi:hypothetical protein